MEENIKQLLGSTVENWNRMLSPKVDSLSDEFMSTFYQLSDAVRAWVNELNPRPASLNELLQLPLIAEILAQLPEDLHLNFHTEAELILENKTRIDG